MTIPRKARLYLVVTSVVGALVCVWQLPVWTEPHIWWFVVASIIASLTQIFQVRGLVPNSYYNASEVIYSFALLALGRPEALWIVVLSNLVAWLRRPRSIPWFAQAFNVGTLVIPLSAADLARQLVAPTPGASDALKVLGIIVAATVFVTLNHLMIGGIHWLTEGKRLGESGVFGHVLISADITLFAMGAAAALMWPVNPYAVLLIVSPLYLIYLTLQMPVLQRQAESDSKTGLFNARHFMHALTKELERAERFDRPLSVIMADLDYMRNVNNTYGHLAGDVVLTGVAALLRRSVREYDIVARFGGEEFAFLLLETTPETVWPRVESIRAAIEAAAFPVSTSPTPLKVTMSFGIAGRQRMGQSAEEILQHADQALYQAKRAGRNRVCLFTDADDDSLSSVNDRKSVRDQPVTPDHFQMEVAARQMMP